MEHIKRTNRELAYKGSILEFYKDTMVTPDGKVAYWDHIEHKGAAAKRKPDIGQKKKVLQSLYLL